MTEPPDHVPAGDAAPVRAAPASRPARWLLIAAVATAATVLAALLVPGGPRIGAVTQAPGGLESGLPLTPADPLLPPEVGDPRVRASALQALLDERASAITHDDAAAWTAQQLPSARVPDFADLATLPIDRWRYTVDAATSGADPTEVTLSVTVAYRLDVDDEDALLRERLTLRHSGGGWQVASEATDGPREQPWDLGEVRVARVRSSLVIGIDVAAPTLERYAALADSVARDVTDVWGRGWTRHPVIVVPRSTAMLGKGLARTADSLARIAAVTTAEDGDSGGDVRGADRVWTNTPVMATLSALGREIVLRHEVLHVASGAASTGSTPLWLEEGIAELVGYRGSGVALRTATADVLRAVRAGRGPESLPTAGQFSGSRLTEAYESAHVACDLVADLVGVEGLVRLYREAAAAGGTPTANLDRALRSVLGMSTETFEARWRVRLRALAS